MAWMFDISADLQMFYDQHVRLGKPLRDDLAAKRDLNLDRLNKGLEALEQESGFPRPRPYDWRNQGSYAMHTLNYDPADENDYDIDVGVIFNKGDLPADPLKARQRVADALCKKCTNFTQEPAAKTNAVRVAYVDGYHIDFAVYRTFEDAAGTLQTEHASTTWKARDPLAINKWFTKCVDEKSPTANASLGYYPKVADGQFRRIVRYVKWFAKSRSGWSLPGGLIISTLVSESYKSSDQRDDRSLYDTLKSLKDRLDRDTKVYNPVDFTEFTSNKEIHNQVKKMKEYLGSNLTRLDILSDEGRCTREKARSAWDWIFNHWFWAEKEKVEKSAQDEAVFATALMPYYVSVNCGLASKQGGRVYREYASGSAVLQKNTHLRFSITGTNVPHPFSVTWEVHNTGDEAKADDALTSVTNSGSDLTNWTSTAYKGNHKMVCKITKNGAVVAQTAHLVRIAPGRWWGRLR